MNPISCERVFYFLHYISCFADGSKEKTERFFRRKGRTFWNFWLLKVFMASSGQFLRYRNIAVVTSHFRLVPSEKNPYLHYFSYFVFLIFRFWLKLAIHSRQR